jgi:predicted transposase YbfD/YdcC
MPAHNQRLKKLPWAAILACSVVRTSHGRRARRAVTRRGKKTVEVVYLITRDAGPGRPRGRIRGRWEVENKLHWVGDPQFTLTLLRTA